MSQTSDANIEPYTLLRAALSLFKKDPAELESDQLRQAQRQARNEYEIEARVLNSAEAASVIITEEELERAFAEVRERFDRAQQSPKIVVLHRHESAAKNPEQIESNMRKNRGGERLVG